MLDGTASSLKEKKSGSLRAAPEETAFDDRDVPDAHSPVSSPNPRAPVPDAEARVKRAIVGLSSMATRHILAELARDYERQCGRKVDIRSMGGVEAAKLARTGEPADIVALASKVMESLEAEGHIARGSVKHFARSEIGLAVPAGARRPSLESEKAVRQAMIDAKRVCYSTGPSGDHFKVLCERWGLSDSVLARALKAPPGVPVAVLVANGEADLGVQQLSELIGQAGIAVISPLPQEIQAVTVFSAGVSTMSAEREAARALVAYLASAETAETKRRHGMAPA
jgi:molybdate transport system substrate-binding protein